MTYEYTLAEYMPLTDQIQIHFKAENNTPNNVVKAALDEFLVFDSNPTSTDDVITTSDFSIYPNPTSSEFTIDLGDESDQLSPDKIIVFNNLGQVVEMINWPAGQSAVTVDRALYPGIYFVHLTQDGSVGATQKLMVH